jgi:arylsulfatase A-like enzyme
MSRRLPILRSGIGAFLAVLLCGSAMGQTQPARTAASGARPNILYILADDLGYGDVQCLNPERGKIKTPHLDRLAAEGMTFTDAHSGSAVCTPTRYGLLTGRYAWRTRLQQGVLDGGNDEPLIAADRLTVASFLKQHGYATACIGKWHLGFQSDAKPGKGAKAGAGGGLPVGANILGGPVTRGFDHFFGCSNARTMAALIENDRVIESIEPVAMLPRLARHATDYLRERAEAARGGRPFFLYLPLTSPHTPIVPAAEWRGRSGLNAYADFVMQTDAVVGEVLAALEREGLSGNTLVFFTADNGCSPAGKTDELERAGHFASGPFRGYKADIWEGGHRVPFLARWPGKVKPGSQSTQLICHSDLLATCAELLGAKLPATAGEDSVSILPALLGTAKAPLHEAVVHHSINGSFAIRQGKWKLALCAESGGWSAPTPGSKAAQGLPETQLYDLSADQAESKNLQAEHPEEVARLTKLLEQIVANGRSTPGAKQANDAEIQIRKRAGQPRKTDKAAKQ